jgi:hypothetical protein
MPRQLLHIVWLLSSALLSGFCYAADEDSVSAHHFSIHTAYADSVTTIIPFTKVGNLMVVRGRADTTEGNFVLDTGAPYLVLNITYFRHYPQTEHHDAEQISVNGGEGRTVFQTTIRSFHLGEMSHYNLSADLVPLGHIENVRGIKILGLLGIELFRQCEMIIDFEKSLIYLHRIGKKESSSYRHAMLKEESSYQTIPIDLMDNRIVAQTELAGRKMKFIIDCAAESNLLHSKQPEAVYDLITITRRVLLTGSGTKKAEALYGDLKGLKIGGRELSTLPVLITNLENTCFSYNGCIDGVLGFDFLSLHKIGFNFVSRKMYIWK